MSDIRGHESVIVDDRSLDVTPCPWRDGDTVFRYDQ